MAQQKRKQRRQKSKTEIEFNRAKRNLKARIKYASNRGAYIDPKYLELSQSKYEGYKGTKQIIREMNEVKIPTVSLKKKQEYLEDEYSKRENKKGELRQESGVKTYKEFIEYEQDYYHKKNPISKLLLSRLDILNIQNFIKGIEQAANKYGDGVGQELARILDKLRTMSFSDLHELINEKILYGTSSVDALAQIKELNLIEAVYESGKRILEETDKDTNLSQLEELEKLINSVSPFKVNDKETIGKMDRKDYNGNYKTNDKE